MKNFILILASAILFSCGKETYSPALPKSEPIKENFGPYGAFSKWVCFKGDSIFKDTLTLTYFYTEKCEPFNIFYYQQSYALYNDFSYITWVYENITEKDTLTIVDTDTGKRATFKRQN